MVHRVGVAALLLIFVGCVSSLVMSSSTAAGAPSHRSCPPLMLRLPLVSPNGSIPHHSTNSITTTAEHAAVVCIDIYESSVEVPVSVAAAGREASSWQLHPFNVPLDNVPVYRAVSSGGTAKPQGYISQVQSSLACANSGKRLCSLDEWLAGCRGVDPNSGGGTVYPYGNHYKPGWCNTGRAENPIIELFGPDATFNWTEMNDPRVDLLNDTVSFGGAFPRCTNANVSVFDMSGNLDEWVATVVPATGHGIFKGGYFVDSRINGHGCLYETTAHATWYHDYSLGFRCCVSI